MELWFFDWYMYTCGPEDMLQRKRAMRKAIQSMRYRITWATVPQQVLALQAESGGSMIVYSCPVWKGAYSVQPKHEGG